MEKVLPLIVNLDGTLTPANTTAERIVNAIFRRPFFVISAVVRRIHNLSFLKKDILEMLDYDVATLPIREDFINWLQREHNKGRPIHLVTEADQGIADKIARRFNFIVKATGFAGSTNLSGHRKRRYLQNIYPNGYVYAGNNSRDLPVWKGSNGIVLVDSSSRTKHAALALGRPIEAIFTYRSVGISAWWNSLKVHHNVKNVLVFVPLFLSGMYYNLSAVGSSIGAFISLGLVASGSYILNDLADLQADRVHLSKRHRPFASCKCGVGSGLLLALALITLGLGIAIMFVQELAFVIGAYLGITLSYSACLKRYPIIDVVILSGLFTLRILMGSVAISVDISHWLMIFSMFFFLSLSLAKRHTEILAYDGIKFRGYRADDASITLVAGFSSGIAAVVILCMYLAEEAFRSNLYAEHDFLWIVPFVLTVWTLRIWLLTQRGELDDDPVMFALRDWQSLSLGAIVFVAFFAATFVGQ